jgi:hypothetical protein
LGCIRTGIGRCRLGLQNPRLLSHPHEVRDRLFVDDRRLGLALLPDRAQYETALLPAPFWCTYACNRPTSTGAGRSDPLWLCWRGKPWLAIRWRGYAAFKWSQLERQFNFRPAAITKIAERAPLRARAQQRKLRASANFPTRGIAKSAGRIRTAGEDPDRREGVYCFAALVVGRPFDLRDPLRFGSRWN